MCNDTLKYDNTNSVTTTKGYVIPFDQIHKFYKMSWRANGEDNQIDDHVIIECVDRDYFAAKVTYDDMFIMIASWKEGNK